MGSGHQGVADRQGGSFFVREVFKGWRSPPPPPAPPGYVADPGKKYVYQIRVRIAPDATESRFNMYNNASKMHSDRGQNIQSKNAF